MSKKSRRFFPQRKAYGFLIEIYELSLLKDLCFLHKKVEVKIMNKPVEHALNSYYTAERIQGELYFHMAQRIAQTLLADKLISQKEFYILSDINRETFPPLFAEILPKTLEISY